MNCPPPGDLVEHAFGDADTAARSRLAPHLEDCASCHGELEALRETANALRRNAWSDAPTSTACLSDGELAAAAEPAEGIGDEERGRWFAHMAACDPCRRRLVALERLLREDAVAAELKRLERTSPDASRRRFAHPYVAAAAVLAVAVLGGVMLRSEAPPDPLALYEEGASTHRESALTTTIEPRILAPVGPAAAADSLVWSSVPHADRYRIRVFERDGTLAWDAHTNDTTMALPPRLSGTTANAYLWKVEARTGWDRWVASEWHDLVIRSETLPR